MRFFRLARDKNIPNPIMPTNQLPPDYIYNLKKENFDVMDACVVAYYNRVGYPTWCDFLFRPLFAISNRYKEMLGDVADLEFKAIQFLPKDIDPEKIVPEDCCLYWIPFSEPKDAVHDDTEYLGIGTISNLVLDADKIGDEDIFSIATKVEKIWLVSLPLAEQILSMGPLGLSLAEVDMR